MDISNWASKAFNTQNNGHGLALGKLLGPLNALAGRGAQMAAPDSLGARPVDSLQAPDGMQILASELKGKLNSIAPAQSLEIADPYSPEAVAERISGFVAQNMAREKAGGASDKELEHIYQQSMQGLQEGFAEAQQILGDMGLYTGALQTTVETTLEQTLGAMRAVHESFFPEPVASVESPAAQRTSSISSLSSFSAQERFSFELTTQEGDKVKINLSQSMSNTQYASQAEGQSLLAQSERYSSAYNLQVEGDLNEEEMAAISSLLEQVRGLSADFYAGDLDKAFAQAQNLGFDGAQISGFSLDLQQSLSYSQVEQYRSTADFAEGENPHIAGLRELIAYSAKLQEGLEAAAENFANGPSLFERLLEVEDALREQREEMSGALAEMQTLHEQLLQGLDQEA